MYEPGWTVARRSDKRQGSILNVSTSGDGPPGNYMVEWLRVLWDDDQSIESVRPEDVDIVSKR